uniref:Uncharacterized protein n=1 Tax=Brassica oleracea TaxID=3712 RepID=A0A3P6CCB2_BRAOL|nr:unnamed protein product [Brassica oleracea]
MALIRVNQTVSYWFLNGNRAPKSRVVTSLAGSSIRNGPVSLNPATGLARAISEVWFAR